MNTWMKYEIRNTNVVVESKKAKQRPVRKSVDRWLVGFVAFAALAALTVVASVMAFPGSVTEVYAAPHSEIAAVELETTRFQAVPLTWQLIETPVPADGGLTGTPSEVSPQNRQFIEMPAAANIGLAATPSEVSPNDRLFIEMPATAAAGLAATPSEVSPQNRQFIEMPASDFTKVAGITQ